MQKAFSAEIKGKALLLFWVPKTKINTRAEIIYPLVVSY